MMKGEMWFICKDAAPLSESGIFFRTLKQAQYFQSKGYTVKIICSDWVHNTQICHKAESFLKSEIHDNVEYIFLKSLYYGNSGLKRLVSYVKFAFDIKKLLKVMPKPDVIIHTSRIPFDYHICNFARKCKAKYIMDVSDLWPRDLGENGYLPKDGWCLRFLYQIERRLYSKADHVVFSIEGGPDYIKEKGWDKQSNNGPIDLAKVHYVNTGLDLQEFNDRYEINQIDDSDLNDPNTFKVIYLGTMRDSNDVGQIIETAKYLSDYKDIKFLLYGDGPDRQMLENCVNNEQITNVVLKDKWVTPPFVPYILKKSSLNLLNYMKGWAPYGGSMNKMFMAMAAGKPILCNAGMGYSPIRKYHIGTDKYLATPKEYAEAILTYYKLDKVEYETLCNNCKRAAEDFDCYKLIKNMETYCGL